jgi:hypothetical protein
MNPTYLRCQFDFKAGWKDRLVASATEFYRRYGSAPMLAIINLGHKDCPDAIGTMKVLRGWGPQQNEVDLGPIPGEMIQPVEQAPAMESTNG